MAQLFWGVGFGFIAPVWPLYLGELGAAPKDIGAVLGAGFAAAAALILPAGQLADRIGRRPVLIAINLAGLLGALAFLPLTHWHGAFAGSVLYNVGLAALPILTAHVAATEGRARMGRAMGIVYAAFFAGIIVAAPLSGIVAAAVGSRATIGSGAALFGLSTLAVAFLRDSRPKPAGATRFPPLVWRLLAVTPLASFIAQLAMPLFPVYLRGTATVPLEQVGLYVGLLAIGSAGFSVLAGRLFDAVGASLTVVGLGMTFACGALALALLPGPIAIGIGSVLLGANVAANPAIAATLERVLPPSRLAAGYAAFSLAFVSGQAGAAVAAGWLYDADPLLPLLVTACLAVPVAAVVALVVRRARELSGAGAP